MPRPTPGMKPYVGTIQAGEQLGRKEIYGPGRRQTAYKSGACHAVEAAANSVLGYSNRSMACR